MREIRANKWQLTVEWTVTTGGVAEVAVGVLDVAAAEEVVAGAEVAATLAAEVSLADEVADVGTSDVAGSDEAGSHCERGQ